MFVIEKQKKRHLLVKRSFLEVVEDEVILSDKKETRRVFVLHPGASAILAFTPEGDIILTRQYRYPIRQESIEIPAGKLDCLEEDPLCCAKRELEEETGYASNEFRLFQTYYPCVGYSDEILYIYIATNCYRVEQPRPQDSDECIETFLLSLDEAKAMLKRGSFRDGKTIIALQKYILENQEDGKDQT